MHVHVCACVKYCACMAADKAFLGALEEHMAGYGYAAPDRG